MIELTHAQLEALDREKQLAAFVDPRTGQEYRLIRKEICDLVGGILKPFNRDVDDDPDMDVYEQYRKKA